MIKLLVGHKGSGKTKQMIDLANESVKDAKGSIIFINKNQRLMYDLKYRIRVICMEDFEHVTNSDEYIGFLYGVISSDHDIETIYIDSILKHADFALGDLPEFIDRLKDISKNYGMDFVVSLSAEKEEMKAATEEAPAADFAQTNVQTVGVDEGDIVKNDGRYLYQLLMGEEYGYSNGVSHMPW